MVVFNDSLVVDALLALSIIFGALYYYMTSTYDYWKKRGVPYVEPTLFFGNVKNQVLLKKHSFFVMQDIYNGLAGEKFGGYFELRRPVLMIRDTDLIERILIKDFSYFSDRDFGLDLKREPLSGNLFNLKGHVWRNLRNKLTPTFTTGKLKGMLEQISSCGDELLNEIEKTILNKESADIKKLGSMFTVDVVAICSFGLQFKPNSPEGIHFRQMVEESFAPSLRLILRITCSLYFKSISKLLKIQQFPKKVSEYMINIVKTTMDYREKNNIKRNDFLQLMMNLKTQEAEGKVINWTTELSEEDAYLNQMDYSVKDGQQENGIKVMSDECIAAQSFVFLTAGSEAMANSISYILYELASNPDIQKRLQEEVDSVFKKYDGKLTYAGLKEMPYLDLIIQEKNRKYSEGGFLMRVCTTPYKIPGTNVVLEKGTRVTIPVYAIHNDEAHYPEPEKFIPERFEGNNHRTTGTYLPFGNGPRICIAMRFAILEMKACIAQIMSKYAVSLDSRTKVPLQYHTSSFMLVPIGGIWVNFHKRTQMFD